MCNVGLDEPVFPASISEGGVDEPANMDIFQPAMDIFQPAHEDISEPVSRSTTTAALGNDSFLTLTDIAGAYFCIQSLQKFLQL